MRRNYDDLSVSSLNSQEDDEIRRKLDQELQDYEIESLYKQSLNDHEER